jgi:glutamyl-tRNA synthetase
VLFNWLFARRTGGEFLLRIEDTDTERNQPELTDDILRSIEWLGLGWDGEPVHQSDERPRHLDAAEQLVAAGAAFWSAWTPAQGSGPPERRASDRDAGLGPGEGRALRYRVPDAGSTTFTDLIRGEVSVEHDDIEDFVLVRANGTPMFLLANAVDDATMGITHVLRGEEHVNGTPKYLLIQAALGVVERPVFAHLPILVDEQRKKLSKRKHAVAVSDFRDRGILPEAMVNYLALLGWGPPDGIEIRPLSEIAELFRLEDVNPSPAFFDTKKLEAINGEYLRALRIDEFVKRVGPFVANGERSQAAVRQLAPEIQTRIRTLAEAEDFVDFVWRDDLDWDDSAWTKAVKDERAGPMLDAVASAWGSCEWAVGPVWASFQDAARSVGWVRDDGEVNLRGAQAPVRVAVTGRSVGPPLPESVVAVGRERVLARLREARAKL